MENKDAIIARAVSALKQPDVMVLDAEVRHICDHSEHLVKYRYKIIILSLEDAEILKIIWEETSQEFNENTCTVLDFDSQNYRDHAIAGLKSPRAINPNVETLASFVR